MEKVEGLMKNLKLSDAEMKRLKISSGSRSNTAAVHPKAMGKVISEKPANAEGIANALGRIWCPLRGIHCKKVGENIFLFTFYQASGKVKALDEGPWMFGNDLLVLEDFDDNKDPEEYEFSSFPIWVRVFKLPLGMMNRDTAMAIGAEIGEFLEAETDEDGMAYGQYLRIKVRMEIAKPLMRGKMVQIGEEGRLKWCPFEYEFLPVFCFTCGRIGHIDKGCSIKLKEGEIQQYGKWLKRTPHQRGSGSYDRPQRTNSNSGDTRLPGSTGSKGSGAGSDSLSWRKEEPFLLKEADKRGEDREVTSTRQNIKEKTTQNSLMGEKKNLCDKDAKKTSEVDMMAVEKEENRQNIEMKKKEIKMVKPEGIENLINIPVMLEWKQTKYEEGDVSKNKDKTIATNKEVKQAKFRRKDRKITGIQARNSGKATAIVGAKRTNMVEEMEEDTKVVTKKLKEDERQENTPQMFAGLSEQPCGEQ